MPLAKSQFSEKNQRKSWGVGAGGVSRENFGWSWVGVIGKRAAKYRRVLQDSIAPGLYYGRAGRRATPPRAAGASKCCGAGKEA